MRSRLLIVSVVILTALGAVAANAAGAVSYRGDLASVETQFMCVSCHEPLELVSSPQAISEKATLQSFIDKGLTLSQIKAAMVAQYGVAVLAKPPAHGFNLTVYILPPLVLVAGLVLLAFTLPKWRARSRRAAVTPLPEGNPLNPAEADRLDHELDRFL